MIPPERVTVVHNLPGHVDVHVAKARSDGEWIVDRWTDGWSCTCYGHMALGKDCEHITAAKAAVAALPKAGAA